MRLRAACELVLGRRRRRCEGLRSREEIVFSGEVVKMNACGACELACVHGGEKSEGEIFSQARSRNGKDSKFDLLRVLRRVIR